MAGFGSAAAAREAARGANGLFGAQPRIRTGFGSVEAAREAARRADGRFGEQPHSDPGDDLLTGEPVMHREWQNYEVPGSGTFGGDDPDLDLR